ncbi:hypothetical protein SCHPADRAFT_902263 [Schizopora paradoxa]|uniref:Uncharacterized protein n=1 Tax=Schizopora paradoxa TaxID=27342 RepID=A0A0H2RVI7_9AGAM|nr:hypothetical protein SCHPADRAFT_902263 [Schizopora paradoxa]
MPNPRWNLVAHRRSKQRSWPWQTRLATSVPVVARRSSSSTVHRPLAPGVHHEKLKIAFDYFTTSRKRYGLLAESFTPWLSSRKPVLAKERGKGQKLTLFLGIIFGI